MNSTCVPKNATAKELREPYTAYAIIEPLPRLYPVGICQFFPRYRT